jgi:branched-chain amino acid transport system ATP-binding protein
MNPQESARAHRLHAQLRDERGLTILLIEHDMKVVMGVSERSRCSTTARRSPRARRRRCARTRASSRPTSASRRGGGSEARWRSSRVEDIHTFYGNIEALKGISLEVEEGEIVTLIGSNGAGKSTTLRSISGSRRRARARSASRAGDHARAAAGDRRALGISQSPEGRRCFPRMTVRENLELGAYLRKDARDREDLERVFELFPRLKEREKQKAGTMSGGEQQMLAIGRALMARPKLLLLDEPSMGLAPILVERIYETIARSTEQGTTILLVEQNANYGARRLQPRLRARDRRDRRRRDRRQRSQGISRGGPGIDLRRIARPARGRILRASRISPFGSRLGTDSTVSAARTTSSSSG